MALQLARVRQRKDGTRYIEVEPEFLLASTMLVHIERLPEVVVLAKRSWAMADTFEACFLFKGWRFLMDMPFGGIVIAPLDTRAPADVFDELAAHVQAYRTVNPLQLALAIARYFFLPGSIDMRGPQH